MGSLVNRAVLRLCSWVMHQPQLLVMSHLLRRLPGVVPQSSLLALAWLPAAFSPKAAARQNAF